jgi:LysM repeat protein
MTSGVKHEDIEVAHLGELTIFGNRGQYELEIESFFPAKYNKYFCEYANIPKPYDAIKKLIHWSHGTRPLRLTITGTNINMLVTIREVKQEEKFGEVGDVYYTLSLKEYRTYQVKKTTKKPSTGGGSTNHPSAKWKYYTITKGDTLVEIAEAYSNCSLQNIYDLNPGIKAREKRLQVGEKIKIPANAVKIKAVQKVSTKKGTRPYYGSSSTSKGSGTTYTAPKTSTPKSIGGNSPKIPYSLLVQKEWIGEREQEPTIKKAPSLPSVIHGLKGLYDKAKTFFGNLF